MKNNSTNIGLNGTSYLWPNRPVVVVCIDGGGPEYLTHAIEAGLTPTIEKFTREGFYGLAQGSMPSFTCPNNMSIATGCLPKDHGVSGNFYMDRATGQPVVMTSPDLLRTRTIMAEFSLHGARVATITAKDKLRKQLQKDMVFDNGSVSFSAQFCENCSISENGIDNIIEFVGLPQPDMYSAELSLFVLDAGIKLLKKRRPDILYLSLTDYIQHIYSPEDTEAGRFYQQLDSRFKTIQELGAVLGLTADHGMGDKADEQGNPNVIWLGDVLDQIFGVGACTVICPITDAFVAHHGALGGFVRVYCHKTDIVDQVISTISELSGIAKVWNREEVCNELEQPPDREADIAVMADAKTVIGSLRINHDLSALKGKRLRSHGSIWEAQVPFVISEPLNEEYALRAAQGNLRSHQIFEFVMNGISR